MYTAEIIFKRSARSGKEDVEPAIWDYMIALERNGQIAERDYVFMEVRGGYKAIAMLPEATSLRLPRPNRYIRRSLHALKKCGIEVSNGHLLGLAVESSIVCLCRRRPSMVLQTDFLSVEPPLRCGKCFGRVPLYRIPHTTEYGTYEDILRWAWRYRALDTLWTDSGVGEQFGYREMSRHDSDLSETGRDICRRIEKKCGVPVYYYLHRYYARSVASEKRRPCPRCGKKWLVEPPWMDRYDFRCDRCRLVSNIGFDVRTS